MGTDSVLGDDGVAQAGTSMVGLQVEAIVAGLVSLARLELRLEEVFLRVVLEAGGSGQEGGEGEEGGEEMHLGKLVLRGLTLTSVSIGGLFILSTTPAIWIR